MKKNNGFTLIELLAVIIILAIIALIATPIIINVVDDVRTQGFKQTALGYYKAAEYIYDEMMMNGKTENIQFTFEDGKQISSNENYKLEVKGETPQGGLVYLTKEGHIAVSINNNKYCIYVDGNKEVTISEDINHCGYTPVPEGCYSISREALSDTNLDGSEEWMTAEYNVLSYNTRSCPKKFDILIIPSEIDGQVVEAVSFELYKIRTVSANDLIFPEGLKMIYNSFKNSPTANNPGIKNVIIPDSVIYIGNSAFNSNQLTNITLPSNLKYIGNYAFNNNPLTSVEIPEGVTNIGQYAFASNQLTRITIPSSVTSIGDGAFSGNEFKEVMIGDVNMTIRNVMFLGSKIDKLVIGQGGTGNINIGDYAFSFATIDNDTYNQDYSLKTLILGNSVKSIGNYAFRGNQLTHVDIPNSVTSVGAEAFAYNHLVSVTIPNSITNIPWQAFRDNQLTSIIIPSSVMSIGEGAFYDNQLHKVTISEGVKTIEAGAFYNNQLTSITIPSSVTSIGSDAFRNNQFSNKAAITIEGDATRFDSEWKLFGFPTE